MQNEEQIRNAYGRILEKARKFNAEANIEGVLVQEMVGSGLECMIGVKDPILVRLSPSVWEEYMSKC